MVALEAARTTQLLPEHLRPVERPCASRAQADAPTPHPGDGLLAASTTVSFVSILCGTQYDPFSDAFSFTGSMTTPRYNHSATLLQDGDVLIVGGSASSVTGAPLATAELFNPGSEGSVAKLVEK